MTDLKF